MDVQAVIAAKNKETARSRQRVFAKKASKDQTGDLLAQRFREYEVSGSAEAFKALRQAVQLWEKFA